jgi:polyhydroxyalkanoate synthesis regulator phasin
MKLSCGIASKVMLGAVIALITLVTSLTSMAQDMEAVQNRLLKGVKKGELSLQQAAAMMEMLGDLAREHEHESEFENHIRQMEEELHVAEIELKEMVEAGKMSPREARNRLREMENEIKHHLEAHEHEHDGHEHDNHEHDGESHEVEIEIRLDSDDMNATQKRKFMAGIKRIEMAVENGRISGEDAKKRIMEMKSRIFADKQESNEDVRQKRFEAAVEQIKKAVESGEVSEEAARKRIENLKQRMDRAAQSAKPKAKPGETSEDERNRTIEGMKARVAKINEAIKTGKMTHKEGMAAVEKMQKKVDVPLGEPAKGRERSNRRGNSDQRGDADRRGKDQSNDRVDMENFRRRIEQAVRNGSMDREEAGKKIRAMEEKAEGNRNEEMTDSQKAAGSRRIELAIKRVESAVDAGRLSRKEADSTIAKLKERLQAMDKKDR